MWKWNRFFLSRTNFSNFCFELYKWCLLIWKSCSNYYYKACNTSITLISCFSSNCMLLKRLYIYIHLCISILKTLFTVYLPVNCQYMDQRIILIHLDINFDHFYVLSVFFYTIKSCKCHVFSKILEIWCMSRIRLIKSRHQVGSNPYTLLYSKYMVCMHN